MALAWRREKRLPEGAKRGVLWPELGESLAQSIQLGDNSCHYNRKRRLIVDVDKIREQLAADGYFSTSINEFKELARAARDEYLASMQSWTLNAPKTKMNPRDLIERPWRKLAIGSSNGVGEAYAQLLQTTYFDEQYPGYNALRSLFSKLIALRNEISGKPRDFGSVPQRDGFWNACRIHHYPRGGGFMSAHRDTHFPKCLEGAGHPFLQVMTLLSDRGRDFFTGGGYIIDRQGQKKYFEDQDSLGDVVAFDGSIVHGVEDIDGDQVMDFTLGTGRLAAFVNLYQVLP